ncbi:MAG: sensor histidine kinase [Spirochaetota bacterium]
MIADDVVPYSVAGEVLDQSPVGIVVVEERMRIVAWNEAMCRWTGVARDDAVGKALTDVFPELGSGRYQGRLRELAATGAPVVFHGSLNPNLLRTDDGASRLPHYRMTARRLGEDGSTCRLAFWVENTSLLDETIGCLREEISARRRTEEELEDALRSKDVLYRELQHRVKNSLSLISSLVSLERFDPRSADVTETLDEVQSRIESIVLVYNQLSVGTHYGEIDLGAYLASLVPAVYSSLAWPPGMPDPALDLESCLVPVDVAIPLGLVVNELLTNAAKHAFPSERAGALRVELHASEASWELTVADDGAASVGSGGSKLDLVRLLVDQIDGSLVEESSPAGSEFRLEFAVRSVPTIERGGPTC